MAGRPKQMRYIIHTPIIKGFKSYGGDSHISVEPVLISFEEYEALRLCDYEGLNHGEAAEVMHISRPTFTRVYQSVRQKLATAFVEGRQMMIQGGQVCLDKKWIHCNQCGSFYNVNVADNFSITLCPLCCRKKELNIMIASQGNHLNDKIDISFGRAYYYVYYNTETSELSYIANPHRYLDEEVAVKTMELLKQYHVDMVIGQRFGKKMTLLLEQSEIPISMFRKNMTIQNIINIIKKIKN